MKRFCQLTLIIFLATLSTFSSAAEFKVVFINPGHPQGDETGKFWSDVNRFMQAAAKDLNIELATLFANRNHIQMKTLAKNIEKHNPDYVIIVNEKGVGVDLVHLIAPHKLPIFTLLNGFTTEELAKLSEQELRLIIGNLVPDNFLAGKGLMQTLYQRHLKSHTKHTNVAVLALLGDYRSWAATERQAGLTSEISENANLELFDSTVANWSQDEAYRKVKGLLQRKNVDIIWAANDPMAFGASKAVKEAGLNKQITIGGVNWDLTYQDRPIEISFGGHVTLGAKSLVMLADYHAGLMKECEMHVKHNIFLSSNGDKHARFHANTQGKNIESFDFRRFSKRQNKPVIYSLNVFIDNSYYTKPYTVPKNACSTQ